MSKEISRKSLYFLIDREYSNIQGYLRNCKLSVKGIYYNIKELYNTVITETNPMRIVVVESGYGIFTGAGATEKFLEFLDICGDDTSITIFYTDKDIKVSGKRMIKERDNKNIEFIKFTGMPQVLAYIVYKGERYTKEHRNNDRDTEELLNTTVVSDSKTVDILTKPIGFLNNEIAGEVLKNSGGWKKVRAFKFNG